MKPTAASLVSFALAALVPASLVVGWYSLDTFNVQGASGDPYVWLRIRNFAILSSFVSLSHVVVLGLPAFFLLRHLRAVTWYSSAAAGFALACIPIGLFTWPLGYPPGSSASHSVNGKMVATLVNGIPTVSGWLDWLWGMAFMGLLGAVGGLSFWLVWHRAVHATPPPLSVAVGFRVRG